MTDVARHLDHAQTSIESARQAFRIGQREIALLHVKRAASTLLELLHSLALGAFR